MSDSRLVNYTKISPNSSPRTAKIDKITIHHMAGNLSVEACANVFQNTSRQASSNYGVGTDGRIGLYVDESRRAWTSSNRDNDNRAVTIEVANSGGGPNWPVSEKALKATIDLCVDICKRNGISRLNFTGDKSGNLTMHKWFAATQCPGPYLESKFSHIAEEVNKRLSAGQTSKPGNDTSSSGNTAQSGTSGLVWCVQIGAYNHKKTAEARAKSAEADGLAFTVVHADGLYKVQSKGYANKADATAFMAEVKKAGFTAFLTTRVEESTSQNKKPLARIAQEVVWGQWGNGAERKERLTAAGYNYDEVQALVNKMMGR